MLETLKNLTIELSTPLILAAMGGFTSERGGVINIGLEGLMLIAACMAALTAVPYGAVAGLIGALVASVALSLLHWLATQKYRINQVISGMAINAIAAGGSNFLFEKFGDPSRSGSIPHLDVRVFEVAAFTLPFALWAFARWTRSGLRLQAVGSDPDRARLAGASPLRIRFAGLIATGVLAGLGGVMLVSNSGVFTNDMTAGKGYIALAALILGGWRPVPALAACLAFGFFSALQIQFQGQTFAGLNVPSELWASLPYIATVIALAGFLGKSRTPAGLGNL